MEYLISDILSLLRIIKYKIKYYFLIINLKKGRNFTIYALLKNFKINNLILKVPLIVFFCLSFKYLEKQWYDQVDKACKQFESLHPGMFHEDKIDIVC